MYSKTVKSRSTKKPNRTSNKDRIVKSNNRTRKLNEKKVREDSSTDPSIRIGNGLIYSPDQTVAEKTGETPLPTTVGQRRKDNPSYVSKSKRNERRKYFTSLIDGKEVLLPVYKGDKPTAKFKKVTAMPRTSNRTNRSELRVIVKLNKATRTEEFLLEMCKKRTDRTSDKALVRFNTKYARKFNATVKKSMAGKISVVSGPPVKIDRVKAARDAQKALVKSFSIVRQESILDTVHSKALKMNVHINNTINKAIKKGAQEAYAA